MCTRLYPSFILPLQNGTFTTREFSKLLVAQRSLFQSEKLLIPSIISSTDANPALRTSASTPSNSIAVQLPYISRLLLLSAYLASYNPSRTDIHQFSTLSAARKKKRGGGTALKRGRPGTSKHRKISRKLLGPQVFVMERMLAIFHAVFLESSGVGSFAGKAGFGNPGRGVRGVGGMSADVLMAVKTLESLRLVGKTSGGADELEGGTKWRVCVGWDVVRGVARSVGVEIEDFLAE
jgi:origin recognition complex subunit 5